ncbi:MAG: hypothetical protein GY774_03070 [Planctomycetes bacterium]|nr:hypothetical protein [Planctomycetota bacterium]
MFSLGYRLKEIFYRVVILFSVFVVMPGVSTARVNCIQLTSEHTADMTDLMRFRQFSAWKDKEGNDLALAVWKYLCGYETGLYHFNEILEGQDPFDEYATVRDPLKILNVYNMGYCGIFGPVLDGIFQGIGFEKGRSFGLEAWNHCATELWYDNAWHYLDLDVRGVLTDADGVVVSLDEAKRNKKLWTNPPVKMEPFFPKDHDKNRVFEIYRGSRVHYYYRWFEGSHTMDFFLRQGESFTRFWTPQGGRWNHLPRYNKSKWVNKLIREEPVGMKPNHREFTRWNHGNGLFQYAPDLSEESTDFSDGVYSAQNLVSGKKGLYLKRTGDGEAIFEVFTPYIIVAKINGLEDPTDDSQASIVNVEAFLPFKAAISLDHGMSWKTVGKYERKGKAVIDLTDMVKGTYGYLLKLSTFGREKEAAIKFLKINTWVQVAPISLPRLKKGRNNFKYDLGDRYGLATIPMLVNPNTADPEDLKKYLIKMPKDYDPKRNTCRIRGDVIMRLIAPEGMKIIWFSTGATFRTYQGEHAKNTDNRIAYSVYGPADFKEIYSSSVPTWVNHWRYNWDEDVILESPDEQVYVKFTGNPGLNTIHACLHLLPKNPPKSTVRIEHGYKITGQLQSKLVKLDRPGSYAVDCISEPENIFIKISVPSQ